MKKNLRTVMAVICAVAMLLSLPGAAFADNGAPSAADLDAIHADIVYPKSDDMYLSEYQTAKVNRNTVYVFRDPGVNNDVWRKGNYFTITKNTEVTILAKSSGYCCVIINETNDAGWVNGSYLTVTNKHGSWSAPKPQNGGTASPSSADLDAIHADIVYPRLDSMYLPEYRTAVVNHNAVYVFKDPSVNNDVWRKGNYFTITKNTEVTILAMSAGYCCVIINKTNQAGWVNHNYLTETDGNAADPVSQNQANDKPTFYFVDLNDFPVSDTMGRLAVTTKTLNIGGGDCSFFELLTPVKNCVYLEVPMMIQAAEKNGHYKDVTWVGAFRDADTGKWFYSDIYEYEDGEYNSAILYVSEPVSIDAFSVFPYDAPNGYGAFYVGYYQNWLLGFASQKDADTFVNSIK